MRASSSRKSVGLFGIVVSEDDFSPKGKLEYKPASVNGKDTDFKEVAQGLEMARQLFARAAAEREAAKKLRVRKK